MRAKLAAGVLAIIIPLTAAAAWQDVLGGDIDAWEAVLEREEEQSMTEDAELSWQALPGLFPHVPQTGEQESSGRLEELRSERASGFLAVRIDGREVVLRDVPKGTWFFPYVRDVVEAGIMSGYRDAQGRPTGEFGPGNSVTIEEVAKVAVHLPEDLFPDCAVISRNVTASGSWGAAYVGCAETRGWAVYSDATVDVKRPATRAEVIVTILQAYDVVLGEKTGTAFMDVTLGTEFGAAIERAKMDGIVIGYTDAHGQPTGRFGPQESVTRAEFAKIVANARQVYRGKMAL